MTEDEVRIASEIRRLLAWINADRAKLTIINISRSNLDKQAAHVMCDIEHAKRRLYELGWTG